jgi:uncharacterized cupin superfamily protein
MLLLGVAGCELPGSVGGDKQQQQDQQQNGGDQQDQTASNIHQGTISANETWKKADGPHIIRGSVYVESEQGVTVTIEPGTLVHFEQDASLNFGLSNGTRGVLLAKGTADLPIVFTSAAATPAKGDWQTLYLGNGAASSILTHCKFSFGGGGSAEEAALSVYGKDNKPTVENCTIEESAGYGIRMSGDASFKAFTNNTIKTSAENPIRLGANEVGSLGDGNIFEENDKPTIYVEGETIDKSATWRNFEVVYFMQGTTYVESASSVPVLTIQAGTTLEFAQNAELNIALSSGTKGALYAVGTEAAPITFTGLGQEAGSWAGIYMGDGTTDGIEGNTGTTVIQHALIEYGGGGEALLDLYYAKPLIKNVRFREAPEGKHAVKGYGTASSIPTMDDIMLSANGNSFGDTPGDMAAREYLLEVQSE